MSHVAPAGESLEGADLTKLDMQFNYIDGDDYVFMDMTTFDTESVSADVIGEQVWVCMCLCVCVY